MSSEIVIDDSSISEFPEEIEKEINKFPKNLKKKYMILLIQLKKNVKS